MKIKAGTIQLKYCIYDYMNNIILLGSHINHANVDTYLHIKN